MFVNLAPDEHHARGGLVAKALRHCGTFYTKPYSRL
jgi:hypothetical protein